MFVLTAFYQLLRSLLVPRLVLMTESLALRQQLLLLNRATNRPRLRHRDRFVLDRLVTTVAGLALYPGDRQTSDGD